MHTGTIGVKELILMNGLEKVRSAFAASVILLVQHGRVSSKYFGEHHSWPSHSQADLGATCQKDVNLLIFSLARS